MASVVVLALLGLPACAGTTPKSEPRHVVPTTIAEIALLDFDVVSFVDVDLHTAVQTREAVESEFGKTYGQAGHPRWFFHAFDKQHLDFVVARFEPSDDHASRYVAQRRLRVKRTREAEKALGVTDTVHEYEIGTKGVKAGMTRAQVTRLLGKPETERRTGFPGATEVRYGAACVRYVDDKVAHVWRRDVCAR